MSLSPNFNARAPSVPLQYIVLHYTGMETPHAALERLRDPAAQVSAHYMIDEAGALFSLVPESERAWHAGASFWREETDLNSASLGIELVNPGHVFGYRPFPHAQIASLKILLHEIIARHGFDSARCLLAHSDIAPCRKEDPGEFFPWEELAREGLGFWPVPTDFTPEKEGECESLLRQIGYDLHNPKAALLAFQRRYAPQCLTGVSDPDTLARLRAVALFLSTGLRATLR